jgi:hypothetical protein
MSRAGGKVVAAGAKHLDFVISGMNSCLHVWLNPNLSKTSC